MNKPAKSVKKAIAKKPAPKGYAGDMPMPIRDEEMRISVSVQVFSSDVPPPAMLAEYEKILPNAAERIFTMAETKIKIVGDTGSARDRHMRHNLWNDTVMIVGSLLIVGFFVIAGVTSGVLGYPILGVMFALAGVVIELLRQFSTRKK